MRVRHIENAVKGLFRITTTLQASVRNTAVEPMAWEGRPTVGGGVAARLRLDPLESCDLFEAIFRDGGNVVMGQYQSRADLATSLGDTTEGRDGNLQVYKWVL